MKNDVSDESGLINDIGISTREAELIVDDNNYIEKNKYRYIQRKKKKRIKVKKLNKHVRR